MLDGKKRFVTKQSHTNNESMLSNFNIQGQRGDPGDFFSFSYDFIAEAGGASWWSGGLC
jgi:hypothetical protein